MFHHFLRCLLLVLINQLCNAQLLPPNQPEQDACNALALCGNSFFTPYSYQGDGIFSDLSATPCGWGSGEQNAVWLKLEISAPGSIVFTITPVLSSDDYDFAIVDITNTNCNSLSSSNVIRCNFNNNQPVFNGGVVGLNTTSTLTSVQAGTTGSSFLQQITATTGSKYLIMINNFGSGGNPSSGFTIDFSGSTAQFVDNTPPHFQSLVAASPCSNKNGVKVHLNTQVACNSIAANGSDFILSPGGTIVSATGVNCSGTNGYTSDINVNFNPALPPGNYTLKAKVGSDNNTLKNLCGTSLSLPDSLNFTVTAGPVFQAVSLSCSTLTVTTQAPINCNSIAANGSDFSITGPSAASITGATGQGCTPGGYTNTIVLNLAGPVLATGTYNIVAQNGTDGNTLEDSCGTFQPVGNAISFQGISNLSTTLTDSFVTCINTGVSLPLTVSNTSPGINYSYQWTPAAGLNSTTIPQPFADPTTDTWYKVTISESSNTMCAHTDSVFVHSLQGFELLNQDTAICEGHSVNIAINGSDEYSYLWTPATGVSNPNIKEPVITPGVNTLYTVLATHPGCNDSVASVYIAVEPNPEGIWVSPDQIICQYDTATLSALASPSTFNFTYFWTPSDDLLYPNGPNTAYFGEQTAYIKVRAATPIGCSVTDSILVTVLPGNFLTVNTTDTGYCPGGQFQLEAAGGRSYEWSPAAGLSDTHIANPIAHPGTSTDYMVIGTHSNGCSDTQTVSIWVYPQAVIHLDDSVQLYNGEQHQIETQGNCSYFKWFPSSGLSADNISNPMAYPELRTRYFVEATTEMGCTTKDSIDVLRPASVINMPNAFNPSTSDPEFKIAKRGIAKLNNFQIFNRWGQLLFETKDINKGWDGTFNSKSQPMGVYVYMIDAITDGGEPLIRKGTVTLIR